MSDRKTMIPELLPDPKVRTTSQASPRDRVVRQMRELMKAGLLATGSVLATTGCGFPGTGFGVVDPIPSPPPTKERPLCQSINPDTGFSAKARRDNDIISVVLTVHDPSADDETFVLFVPTLIRGGTSTTGTEAEGNGLESTVRVFIKPNAGATEVSLDIPLTCGRELLPLADGTTGLRLTVSLTDTADGGTASDAGALDFPLPVEIEPIHSNE